MPKQPNAGERPVAFHRPRRDVARMTVRLHHQRMSIASFLALLCDAVRPADQKPWLDYADIKKRPDPEYGHAYPQSALPGSCKSVEQRARNAGWSTKRMSGCTMTRPTAMMESWRPRGHNWCAGLLFMPQTQSVLARMRPGVAIGPRPAPLTRQSAKTPKVAPLGRSSS
jgi:hypothetical protein